MAAPAHPWGLPEKGPATLYVAGPVDGDTLAAYLLVPVHVRLDGCNAAEHGTEAGRRAAAAVRGQVAGRLLEAELKGREKYGRLLARVRLEGGADLSDWLVAAGLAEPWDGRGPRPVPPAPAA